MNSKKRKVGRKVKSPSQYLIVEFASPIEDTHIRRLPIAGEFYVTETGLILKRVGTQSHNYHQFFPYKSPYVTFQVHRVVACAFLPPPSEDQVIVRHLDGNIHNNHVSNLAWGTIKDNARDRQRHGTQVLGSRQPLAKLTEAEVRKIKQKLLEGLSRREVGRQFGVHGTTVTNIALGKTWKHVPPFEKILATPEHYHFRKISIDDVKEIRRRAQAGETQVSLANRFGISRAQVYNIIGKRSWREVT